MKDVRRMFLCVLVSAMLLAALPSLAAEKFPTKPLTIVVPAGVGGANDIAARLMAPFLSKEIGQPVVVVNRPGGGNLAGHIYFMRQPADGYTLLRSASFAYFTINILIQKADFKVEDFQYINLTDFGTVIIGTSNNSRFKSIDDLIAILRKEPGKVSVGLQPTQSDNINLQIFLKALGLSADSVRIVTYDSGGPVRNGMAGGQFDIGVIGDQGMGPMKGTFRPLMTFSEEQSKMWEVPTVLEVLKKQGVTDYPNVLPGSMQGYLTHSKLKQAYPERYARLIKAFENISKNPEAIEAHKKLDRGIEWLGPERSQQLMIKAHKMLSNPELIQILQPK
jgi:tripartite-type tricarboxylate transporter receptor subunit TctC